MYRLLTPDGLEKSCPRKVLRTWAKNSSGPSLPTPSGGGGRGGSRGVFLELGISSKKMLKKVKNFLKQFFWTPPYHPKNPQKGGVGGGNSLAAQEGKTVLKTKISSNFDFFFINKKSKKVEILLRKPPKRPKNCRKIPSKHWRRRFKKEVPKLTGFGCIGGCKGGFFNFSKSQPDFVSPVPLYI